MANFIPIEHLNEDYDADRYAMTPSRRRKIHKHRKEMDLYGPKLPYDFGIFRHKFGHRFYEFEAVCPKCGYIMYVTKLTCAVICKCGELVKVGQPPHA